MKSAEFRVLSAELKDHPQGVATAVDGFPGIKEPVRCAGSPRCSNWRQVASVLLPSAKVLSTLILTQH